MDGLQVFAARHPAYSKSTSECNFTPLHPKPSGTAQVPPQFCDERLFATEDQQSKYKKAEASEIFRNV
ncbi:hypothetical protein [Roseibium algae]|uniref:Uncharacterized protein n=1 Tax=Roseibium algae TaxID=3123038 RepID=A0ABU8TEJ9_9HYPH